MKIVTELDNGEVHEKAVVDCVTEHLIESVQQVYQHVSDNVAIMKTAGVYNALVVLLLTLV